MSTPNGNAPVPHRQLAAALLQPGLSVNFAFKFPRPRGSQLLNPSGPDSAKFTILSIVLQTSLRLFSHRTQLFGYLVFLTIAWNGCYQNAREAHVRVNRTLKHSKSVSTLLSLSLKLSCTCCLPHRPGGGGGGGSDFYTVCFISIPSTFDAFYISSTIDHK